MWCIIISPTLNSFSVDEPPEAKERDVEKTTNNVKANNLIMLILTIFIWQSTKIRAKVDKLSIVARGFFKIIEIKIEVLTNCFFEVRATFVCQYHLILHPCMNYGSFLAIS